MGKLFQVSCDYMARLCLVVACWLGQTLNQLLCYSFPSLVNFEEPCDKEWL